MGVEILNLFKNIFRIFQSQSQLKLCPVPFVTVSRCKPEIPCRIAILTSQILMSFFFLLTFPSQGEAQKPFSTSYSLPIVLSCAAVKYSLHIIIYFRRRVRHRWKHHLNYEIAFTSLDVQMPWKTICKDDFCHTAISDTMGGWVNIDGMWLSSKSFHCMLLSPSSVLSHTQLQHSDLSLSRWYFLLKCTF